MELRDRIRGARKALGITQEELANRSGVRLNAINRLERGVSTDPHYSTLLGIAKALEIPVTELIEEPVPLAEASTDEVGQSEAGAEEKLERVALAGILRRLSSWGRKRAENEHEHATLLRATELIDYVLFTEAYSLYHSLRERGDEADDLVEPIEEMMRVFDSLIDALKESEEPDRGAMADVIDLPARRKKAESMKRAFHREEVG